eukprot:524879-Pelagomonas_calceolata.AAC.10
MLGLWGIGQPSQPPALGHVGGGGSLGLGCEGQRYTFSYRIYSIHVINTKEKAHTCTFVGMHKTAAVQLPRQQMAYRT